MLTLTDEGLLKSHRLSVAVFPEEVRHTVTLNIIITQIMFWKVVAAERDTTYKYVILDGIFLSAKELQYFCLFVCLFNWFLCFKQVPAHASFWHNIFVILKTQLIGKLLKPELRLLSSATCSYQRHDE